MTLPIPVEAMAVGILWVRSGPGLPEAAGTRAKDPGPVAGFRAGPRVHGPWPTGRRKSRQHGGD